MNKQPEKAMAGANQFDDVSELNALLVQYKERLRSVEFDRLQLERRLHAMERDQQDMIVDFASNQRILGEQVDGGINELLSRISAILGLATAMQEQGKRLAGELKVELHASGRAVEAGILQQVEKLIEEGLRQQCEHADKTLKRLENSLLSASDGLGGLIERGFSKQAERQAESVGELQTSLAGLKGGISEGAEQLARVERNLRAFYGDAIRQEVSGLERSISSDLAEQLRLQLDASKSSIDEFGSRLEVLLDQMIVGQGGHFRGIEKVQALVEQQQGLVQRVQEDIDRMQERELSYTRSQLADLRQLMADSNLQSSRQLESLRAELHCARIEREELAHQLEVLHGSASLALGKTFVTSIKTIRGFFALPYRMFKVSKEHRGKQREQLAGDPSVAEAALPAPLADSGALSEAIETQGLQAAIDFMRQPGQRAERAKILTQVARNRFANDALMAVQIGRLAYEAEPAEYRNRWLAFMEFDAGGLAEPAKRLASMPDRSGWKPAERRKAAHIEALAGWLKRLPQLPDRAAAEPARPSSVVLYVAASSLPYHHTGYTIRTQSVCKALIGEGWDVNVVTRPGYPRDRPDASGEVQEKWQVDGVSYSALPGRGRALPADEALEEAVAALMVVIGSVRPAVVHAASNHENALPALIAARRMGIPFVYEVRGLWELTAASKVDGWESSERFQLEARLEALVAAEADALMTLNTPIAQELLERIGQNRKVVLVPNAIDPAMVNDPVQQVELPEHLRDGLFLLGYAGSVVGYEGLDDFLIALAQLLPEHPGVRALIIGGGDALEGLKQLAETLSISDKVAFIGKTSADLARSYLARCDAVVIPRKPLRVCHVVSPLKPLEAMAMKIPVIASDVRAIAELIDDGKTGLLFRAGDPLDLSRTIVRLMSDAGLRRALPEAAFANVINTRTWAIVADRMGNAYVTASSNAVKPAAAAAPISISAGFPGVAEALISLPVGRNAFTVDERAQFEEGLVHVHGKLGINGLHALVDAQGEGRPPRFLAFCAVRAAQVALEAGDAEGAVSLLSRALAVSDDRNTLKAAARMYFSIGLDETAARFFQILEQRGELDESSARLAAQVNGRIRLLTLPAVRPLETAPEAPAVVVNFLHFSLPYTSVGYATRSHGIARGVAAAGWDIRPYTRLGFPQDFKQELEGTEVPDEDFIDGVHYRRLQGEGRKGLNEVEYLLEAADACEAVLRKEGATLVHAASNYTTALPALVAARRLGIPFVYEVRGFWEVTRSSRDAAFERSAKYRTMKFYEDFMLANSDRVITITSAMREELVERGVPSDRISLAYNSVDVERFNALKRDEDLAERLGIPEGAAVIGYVGSFVDYEGLDDLLHAAAMLRDRGHHFRLLMVGDGAVMDDLRVQIEQLDLQQVAILTGRVPHEEVEAHYSLIDVAPFPRKPWEVCELVSPLKPFEAMAMCKPVVVSSTRALLEIVQDGVNGLVFEKGRIDSLADALERLLVDADLREELGKRSRSWVEENRSWRRAGLDVAGAYELVMHTTMNIAKDGGARE